MITPTSIIGGIRQARARHAAYRRTFDVLSAYSDRELADIRIHRSQIGEIARDAAGRV